MSASPILLEALSIAAAPPGAPQPAVRDVSLAVGAGEWLAVTGANGSGKSTLAMALAGLWPVTAGQVRLNGSPLEPGDALLRRDVAVVFQDPSSQLLQPTVREELTFAARNLDRPADRIERALGRVAADLDLSADFERDPRTLSAGRQQIVLLGAALVTEPALLVADEPGAHLDEEARDLVLAAVRARVAAGLAVVWVTQDHAERGAADRTLVLGRTAGVPTPALQPPVAPPDGPPLAEVRIGPAPASGPSVRIPGLSGFGIPRRGLAAVLGPNGSGKTVLLSSLGGLIRTPQIRVDWRGPAAPPPIMAAQYPEMQIFEERVGDEILHAAVRRGRPRLEAQATISQWLAGAVENPAGFLERRCWTLSAGEKRLVGLLGTLLAPAALVLLDEPTAGLDAALRAVAARLTRLRAAAGPVLVATQDRDWVEDLGAEIVGASGAAQNTASRRQKTD